MFKICFFYLLVISFIIIIFIKRAKIKGWIGEKIVLNILTSLPDEYTIFNDVYLQKGNWSAQIDQIVLSPYGIFVIETKNYKGWIYGKEHAENWTKNIYGKKYSFRNPIKQNYSHVLMLQQLFDLPRHCFIPLVVFTGNCVLKTKYDGIIYSHHLIKEIISYHEILFTPKQLDNLINKLSYSSFSTRETAKEHRKAVKSYISRRETSSRHEICPRCGRKLVLKHGKYDTFLGCSNFPHCNYTRNV